MRQLWYFVWGGVIGAGIMWASMNYHVVRRDGGMTVVPKFHAQLSDTYLDIRGWGITEWTEHPDFVVACKKHDRMDLIGDAKVLGQPLREATELFQ
jgi:hypothetical protein